MIPWIQIARDTQLINNYCDNRQLQSGRRWWKQFYNCDRHPLSASYLCPRWLPSLTNPDSQNKCHVSLYIPLAGNGNSNFHGPYKQMQCNKKPHLQLHIFEFLSFFLCLSTPQKHVNASEITAQQREKWNCLALETDDRFDLFVNKISNLFSTPVVFLSFLYTAISISWSIISHGALVKSRNTMALYVT